MNGFDYPQGRVAPIATRPLFGPMVSMLPLSLAMKRCLTVALAAGLVLGVAGCTDTTEPDPTVSTTTESPSPDPTPTESTPAPEPTAEPTDEPTPPDAAMLINEDTEEGAKSAAKYFFDLYNYSYQALDTTEWDLRSNEDCEFCASVHDSVKTSAGEKRVLKGGEIQILEFTEVELLPSLFWRLDVKVEQSAFEEFSPEGDLLATSEKQQSDGSMFIEFIEGKWYLAEYGVG